ncbi:MAG: transglutaminase-like domain-containing protein, partial [Patescibacteria group bacterium]
MEALPLIENPVIKNISSSQTVGGNAKFKKNPNLSKAAQLAAVRQHLLASHLPSVALDRLNAYEARQPSARQKKVPVQPTIGRLTEQEPFRVETFSGRINTRPVAVFQETESMVNSSARPIDSVGDPLNYLGEGDEIKFTPAIQNKADELNHDPLAMLNFVRNEVSHVPYFGSKKGAHATLLERAGNDMDKASLLVAMLRSSGVPARYRRADIKVNLRTMTDWLGVDSPIAAARILSLEKIPYTLYTLNDEPYFFVVEHTYVEAHIPYGYSRGADPNDGGIAQWVPLEPSINAYYYERFIDVVEHLKGQGFITEEFFDRYLAGDYGDLEPLEAFKREVELSLTSARPEYYPDLTYTEALTRSYPKLQNLDFIPGSLPYKIVTVLGVDAYVPTPFRHSIRFTIKNEQENVILDHRAYVSDLADNEILVTHDPATPEDQTIIDSFDTIYDVVPLALVEVKPTLKINGRVVALGRAASTLGRAESY